MEQSRPCSGGEKDRESQPSVTTVCLSGAACLQLRWNQGEICAALIMSLVWIINESCSPGTRAPTEPINPPPPSPPNTPTCTQRHTNTHSHKEKREKHTLKHPYPHTTTMTHCARWHTYEQQACRYTRRAKIFSTTRAQTFLFTSWSDIQSHLIHLQYKHFSRT